MFTRILAFSFWNGRQFHLLALSYVSVNVQCVTFSIVSLRNPQVIFGFDSDWFKFLKKYLQEMYWRSTAPPIYRYLLFMIILFPVICMNVIYSLWYFGPKWNAPRYNQSDSCLTEGDGQKFNYLLKKYRKPIYSIL